MRVNEEVAGHQTLSRRYICIIFPLLVTVIGRFKGGFDLTHVMGRIAT